MASATSSVARSHLRPIRALLPPIAARLAEGQAVPLLVVRLPEFEEIAWRDGSRAARALERRTSLAFCAAARRLIRDGDALAHDRGSDRFVVAMLTRPRHGKVPETSDCRLALDRIAASVARVTGRRMETGWWAVERIEKSTDLDRAVALALERGARERERYEFLAAVGHELRTPLASIRGYLETLLDGGADPHSARRFLETAQREALRLGRMVDGMLEFSLLDLSPAALAMGACDAAECITAAVEALMPLARRRRIVLEHRTVSGATVRVDFDACMHALLNLLENAVKYSREDGTIRLSCERDGNTVIIAVDDDGPGVRGERILGHGIGLTIARTIAERSGGELRLERSELGGARFVLQLPAGAESAAPAS